MSHSSETEPIPQPTQPRIVATPGTCGGKPRIDGHRIKVQDVVLWHIDMGQSIEDILEGYPGLDREKIDVALAYYETHREEIRELMKQEREFVASMKKNYVSIFERLPKRSNAQDPPIPPR